MAFGAYRDLRHFEQIATQGEIVEARILGGSLDEASVATYATIDVGWVDSRGAQRESITLQPEVANKIIQGKTLLVDHIAVRILPYESGRQVMIVEEADQDIKVAREDIWVGLAGGALGLIIAPLMFWGDYKAHKERKAATEGVDAMLAQMRAGKKPDG